jgi:hypothetical protein
MSTNSVPLLADLFFEGSFYLRRKKSLAVALNSSFSYVDNVLSINNNHFKLYVDLIYLSKLEIKDTAECFTSPSYLDMLLKLDTKGKLMTQLYDKPDDFNFSIVNFPLLYMYIAIFNFHLHMVFIARSWFGMQEPVRHTISFEFEVVYWQIIWCHKYLLFPVEAVSANFTVVIKI